VKESASLRHRHERGTFGPATRLAKDCHPVWISSKLSDVVLHPSQRQYEIEHPHIAGVCIRWIIRNARKVEKPEGIQPVIDGNDNRISTPAEPGSVVENGIYCPTVVGAPVNVEKHGSTFMTPRMW
jgi:hypothetical protein